MTNRVDRFENANRLIFAFSNEKKDMYFDYNVLIELVGSSQQKECDGWRCEAFLAFLISVKV